MWFMIDDDKLIRREDMYDGPGIMIGYRSQVVITKEEFIACYNAWIKENKE